jgi:hypothetical protein
MASQAKVKASTSAAPAQPAQRREPSTPEGATSGFDETAQLLADRESNIAVAAYYKAQHRGFAAGSDIADWLAAEQEYDAHEANRSGVPVAATY